MRARCYDENNRWYANYGGRGIRVCERWRDSFENFLEDMGERPSGTTLDRFPNNNGDYEPGNCRWATKEQQQSNRRIGKRGAKGYWRMPLCKPRPWGAGIAVNGKRYFLGTFASAEEAHAAYEAAKKRFETTVETD